MHRSARFASRLTARRARFMQVSEEPYVRRPADAFRLVVCVGLAGVLSRRSGHNSALSLAVFHAINGLPGELRPLADLLFDVATVWSAVVVVGVSLGARRWRLARDLLLAGLVAWLVARGLGLVLESGFRRGLSATFRTRGSPSFPDVPVAVVMAVVSTAAPYLTRPIRWLGWTVGLSLVPAGMYLGTALPKSLGCAVAVGVASAAGVHLAFGAPGGRPTAAQVQAALRELGADAVTNVQLAAAQPRERTRMLAEQGDARLIINVLGRDERDANRVAALWRFLLFREASPLLFLTRLQEIEHQAYTMLLAQTAGVRVAPLVVAGKAGPSVVLLAERQVSGLSLHDMAGEDISDALLRDVWVQVARLHQVHIAHGRLTTQRVIVEGNRATVVAFDRAATTTSPEARAADTAQLLATTAALVGPDRAITAAIDGLGPDALAQCLPLLQPDALTGDARRLIARSRSELDAKLQELREATARALAQPAPELEALRRVTATGLLLTVTSVIAVASLLSAVGDPAVLADVLRHADPWQLLDAALLALSSTLGYALALSGSTTRRLPFWSNLKVQAAGLFSNIALPLGSQALQIRFLQKQGLSTATAVADGGFLNVLGGTVAQIALLMLTVPAAPAKFDAALLPAGAITRTLEIGTVLILAVSVLALAKPELRRRVLPPLAVGMRSVMRIVRRPRQLVLLLGGSALAYLLSSVALAATLNAVGQSLPISEVIAVSVAVSLVSSLVPLPGGSGAVATVGLSGALIALGVPEPAAVATGLLNPIISQYVPALPGWLALRSLVNNREL